MFHFIKKASMAEAESTSGRSELSFRSFSSFRFFARNFFISSSAIFISLSIPIQNSKKKPIQLWYLMAFGVCHQMSTSNVSLIHWTYGKLHREGQNSSDRNETFNFDMKNIAMTNQFGSESSWKPFGNLVSCFSLNRYHSFEFWHRCLSSISTIFLLSFEN